MKVTHKPLPFVRQPICVFEIFVGNSKAATAEYFPTLQNFMDGNDTVISSVTQFIPALSLCVPAPFSDERDSLGCFKPRVSIPLEEISLDER